MRFVKEYDAFTISNEENVEITKKHFHKVYNNDVEVD